MKFFKQYDLQLVFGIGLPLAIILIQYSYTREVGINLFTELSSVALTVFIINRILERKERQKRVAIDKRILREIQSLIATHFSIWKHITWQYFPDARVETEEDFKLLYPKLIQETCLDRKFDVVSIHHPESWKLFFHNQTIKDCFKNYHDTMKAEVQLFINDFKIFLEPELLDTLLDVMEGEYFKNIYLMCYSTGTDSILIDLEQDINKLESYLIPDEQDHVKQFAELIKYSKKLKATISEFTTDEIDLYQVRNYFTHPARFAKE